MSQPDERKKNRAYEELEEAVPKVLRPEGGSPGDGDGSRVDVGYHACVWLLGLLLALDVLDENGQLVGSLRRGLCSLIVSWSSEVRRNESSDGERTSWSSNFSRLEYSLAPSPLALVAATMRASYSVLSWAETKEVYFWKVWS